MPEMEDHENTHAGMLYDIHSRQIRMEEKLDTALDVLYGTERYGDIGLIKVVADTKKEVADLNHTKISKNSLYVAVTFIAGLASSVVSVLAYTFHAK